MLGPNGARLASSGDDVADAAARERFLTAYEEVHEAKESDGRAVLIIGKDEYPFPIPIVADAGAWRFDTAAGEEEILDRRIGQNELSAIQVLKAYVDAQHEYAEADRDGKGVQYAQRLLSSRGQAGRSLLADRRERAGKPVRTVDRRGARGGLSKAHQTALNPTTAICSGFSTRRARMQPAASGTMLSTDACLEAMA